MTPAILATTEEPPLESEDGTLATSNPVLPSAPKSSDRVWPDAIASRRTILFIPLTNATAEDPEHIDLIILFVPREKEPRCCSCWNLLLRQAAEPSPLLPELGIAVDLS